jgi:hypothetical protein
MRLRVSIMAVLLLFGITMWAQAQAGSSDQSSSGSSTSMSDQNSGSPSQAPSSSSGSSMSSSGSSASQTFDGCIVRHETDYYIVPEQGSAQKITSSNTDLSQHVGHHVQVTGTQTGTAGTSTSASSSGSDSGNEAVVVASVTMVSESCPSDWNTSEMHHMGQGNSGSSNGNANH